MSETLELTDLEKMVLAGEVHHAPSCVWVNGGILVYVGPDGREWMDTKFTIPHDTTECTCGFFNAWHSGRAKLRAQVGR